MVGIAGWGAYVPLYRVSTEEIALHWGSDPKVPLSLGVKEKSVAGPDEDSVTIAWEAAVNALTRAQVDPKDVGMVFIGSESKPYAVKPSSTIIADALGIAPETMAVDAEFACRAASEGLRHALVLVSEGAVRHALIIGTDTAQGAPGDVLEYTAASGGAAFVVSNENVVANFLDAYTFVTDTPDFWRRDGSQFPAHGEGFTGEPAYFYHLYNAIKELMERNSLKPSDVAYFVPHQPNVRFPMKLAKMLGFKREQLMIGLTTADIGNTYNASAFLGMTRVLDNASPGDLVLMAPFGSGAGADAYLFEVTDRVEEAKALAPTTQSYIERRKVIDYATYLRFRNKIKKLAR
ncbi:hydroxymethylglutaryl-CoA synthase [Ignicoccus hospitalis]|uniref:Hydroxymethylglutaryl-CoA synthase n=1 Tax=Ignicoccus hospitalis (strain KIN4/I / DSM 18386 / JCM 14125) TaxID=453591 RepID=A8A9F7_IGNH4|nr:hydroxymethylglutaryl-CoA synthase [Ignicoccus hospitalis]ABU81559.1 putative hydroxymethylglutaryl-CoA synthase [Ignicoccus hospitalis KIN4/I]HIH90494.1 hydroxymethylglutaryl-CoA synthase [Desulfurococcaceae archaeon]